KLHGTLEKLHTLIATEERVIDFVTALLLGEPPLPSTIAGLFAENSFLFIGYGLKDWNVRAMMRALRARSGAARQVANFAIQRRPQRENIAKEWEQAVMFMLKNDEIRSFDMDAVEFAETLETKARSAGLIP